MVITGVIWGGARGCGVSALSQILPISQSYTFICKHVTFLKISISDNHKTKYFSQKVFWPDFYLISRFFSHDYCDFISNIRSSAIKFAGKVNRKTF